MIRKANNNITDNKVELRKQGIIKRILQYSDILNMEDLDRLSLEKLYFLQSNTLVELRVIIKYKRRNLVDKNLHGQKII